ncbi:hypothetical protein MSG28_004884 [Choristoneura fumiferana]|uniref:Uncharacterized protein n=1 Tax=Choristoneura fumiferana TaxID=7141 RepID=A0ACC0JP78_CHOFU|nr:hypothetical protein MSG28_004884 [Choristoneura fumiferana]
MQAVDSDSNMKQKPGSPSDTINPNLLGVSYAVHGPIVERAIQIEKELQKGVQKPFSRVVFANIGDCHALGQQPITFIRQVQALAACPQLMSSPDIPEDVKERVREILGDCTAGSVGAYSPPAGLALVRRHAARWLRARDGVAASPDHVYLGAGATDLICAVLQLLAAPLHGKPPAVMIPVPQYPVFSCALAELGVSAAPYLLDERAGWALPPRALQSAYRAASDTHAVRALVLINPGNPTGQVLSRENMEEVVRFAHEHRLFLLADEVYQENLVDKPFVSFKKVIHSMGPPYDTLELASFMTASKGWAAECGARAALVDIPRLAPQARAAFEDARARAHCPSLLGQCALDCIVKPPAPGEPSYSQFSLERDVIQRALRERAAAAHRALNDIPTFSCNPIEAAMFAFPRFTIPARAHAAARARGVEPDEFYCMQLLEETGTSRLYYDHFDSSDVCYNCDSTLKSINSMT